MLSSSIRTRVARQLYNGGVSLPPVSIIPGFVRFSSMLRDYQESVENYKSKLLNLTPTTISIREISMRIKDGDLNLFPEYQRSFEWKKKDSSRLVVTVLCQRYVPSIVLHAVEPTKFDVLDGKQRLTSLMGFYFGSDVNGIPEKSLPPNFSDLAQLGELDESYASLNGLSFQYLSKEQQKAFEQHPLTILTIPYETDLNDVFEFYCDINSGGQKQNAQQNRKCSHFGPFMRSLYRLASDCEEFQYIRDPKNFGIGSKGNEKVKDDADVEMILRALAFHNSGHNYKAPLSKFLNREVEGVQGTHRIISESSELWKRAEREAETKAETFSKVMKLAYEVFESFAFRRYHKSGGKWDKDVTMLTWDAKYAAIADLLNSGYQHIDFVQAKDAINENWKKESSNIFKGTGNSSQLFISRRDECKKLFEENLLERDRKRVFDRGQCDTLWESKKATVHFVSRL